MPTLYVENVPEELYEAIRTRAQGNRKSITAEVLDILAANVATPTELARRKAFLKRAVRIRSQRPDLTDPFLLPRKYSARTAPAKPPHG